MKTQWASALVETLCGLKRDGWEFEAAWKRALELHPVRGVGWREIPTDDLFESADVGDSPVTFMKRATSDAWHDRKPALRNLRVLSDSEGDASLTYFRWRP